MKLCLACGEAFEGVAWSCPRCRWAPAEAGGLLAFAPDAAAAADSTGGFEPEGFEQLAQLEESSFWFRSRNALIAWALDAYAPQAQSFLEIGCGTGFVLDGISRARSDIRLFGSELFLEGLSHARRRVPAAELMQMDARKVPFESEFDAVGAFDVLEHVDDDRAVLAGMRRALRPGGTVLITVPQHPWLWSPADDYAHHVRRYRRSELVGRIEETGLRLRRVTSFVSLLLPAMMASRLVQSRSRDTYDPLTEHQRAGRLRGPLEAVLRLENALIRRGVRLPFGGSLLAVAGR